MRRDTRAERASKRRFALLVLLHSRLHHYDELIALLDQDHLFDYDRSADASSIARQQYYQFRHDLDALRIIGCNIEFDRRSKCYAWHNSPFGLCLSQEQLSAFVMVLDTFEETTILHATEIQALLTHFVNLLPVEQRTVLTSRRRSFRIDLHETTDYRNADPVTISEIEKAIERRQQLEFSYRSPREGKERRHVIEPRSLVFEHGHVYLYGWSIDYDKELRFRLDYIIPGSADMLHTQIRSSRPRRAAVRLCYRLSAVIARNKVSQHFPQQEVEVHPDGSATVTAQITDLFEARRILLSYGANCKVLEPPALVEEMRTIAAELYKMYDTPGE